MAQEEISIQDNTKFLSDRITSLEESATIAMTQKARDLKNQGHDVISLSVGEPDFNTPEHVKEAGKQAIEDNYTRYTPVPGYNDLRQAICKKLEKDNQLNYQPYNIVVSTGAKHSIANIFQCLLNPGDEVIIFAPYWVTYPASVQLAGGKSVMVSGGIENDFKPTMEAIQDALTDKTKAIIFSSPCNPTGAIFDEAYLRELADLLENYPNVFVISDEIYEFINYQKNHFSIAQVEDFQRRTFVVNGLSKGYAMTGWRIGYLAAPKWLADAVGKFQGQITSGTCSVAQRAALAALTGTMEPTEQMVQAFEKRRKLVLDRLSAMEGVNVAEPQGAFYFFPEVRSFFGKAAGSWNIEDATDLAMYILEEAHVSTVAGDAFGAPGYLRLSYAASEDQLTEALNRIEKALATLS